MKDLIEDIHRTAVIGEYKVAMAAIQQERAAILAIAQTWRTTCAATALKKIIARCQPDQQKIDQP